MFNFFLPAKNSVATCNKYARSNVGHTCKILEKQKKSVKCETNAIKNVRTIFFLIVSNKNVACYNFFLIII